MFSRRGSGRSPTTSPRGRTLPWTPRPPGAGPAAASPPAQSWLVWMLAGRLTLAHLSPRAEGGAGREGGAVFSCPPSARVCSAAPSVRKAFVPESFRLTLGNAASLLFPTFRPLRAPSGPLRPAGCHLRFRPPCRSAFLASLRGPSAPTPCPGARRVRAGPACRAAAHPGSYGRLPGPFHGAPFAAMFFLPRAENVLLGLLRRICVARRVPSSVPPR